MLQRYIHKRFFRIAKDDTSAWEQLFQAVESFGKKYAITPEKQFAQNLVLLVANEIEQKAKGGKEDAEKKQESKTTGNACPSRRCSSFLYCFAINISWNKRRCHMM